MDCTTNTTIPVVISSADFATKFKHPIFTNGIKIRSETAHKSYNDLYHSIYLPLIGDYSFNFVLSSNYVLKSYNGNNITVDYLGNYIEYVSLNINNRETIISCIDSFPKIDTIYSVQQIDKSIIGLEFLNMPILTKCATNSIYLINIKFRQTPPINYTLSYDVMFTDDLSYSDKLSKEYFTLTYMSQQKQKVSKVTHLVYNKGQVSLCP